MTKIVATNKDDKGHVRSVKLLIGASNTDDNTVRYLERPVNKLMMLIQSNVWDFIIWLVRLLAVKPLIHDNQDVLRTSWGEPWRDTFNIDSRLNSQVTNFLVVNMFTTSLFGKNIAIVFRFSNKILLPLCNYQYNHWNLIILFWHFTWKTRSLITPFYYVDNLFIRILLLPREVYCYLVLTFVCHFAYLICVSELMQTQENHLELFDGFALGKASFPNCLSLMQQFIVWELYHY